MGSGECEDVRGTSGRRGLSHVGGAQRMSTMARARGMLSRMGRSSKVDPAEGAGVAIPSSAPEAGDGRLVERATGGDREAFDLLVERHLPRVWAVVWRILRHREDTEDVVQEVFLAAFQGLAGYRGEAKFTTWLHRIAVTRALNHLDRKEEKMRRAFRSLEDGNQLLEAGPEAAATSILRGAPSPLQALE